MEIFNSSSIDGMILKHHFLLSPVFEVKTGASALPVIFHNVTYFLLLCLCVIVYALGNSLREKSNKQKGLSVKSHKFEYCS